MTQIKPARLGAGIGGRIRIRKFKMIENREVETHDSGWFHNIITNTGLDTVADSQFNAATQYCHVGTGTNTEAATDTALQTHTASTNNLNGSVGGAFNTSTPPYYLSMTKTFRFNPNFGSGNVTLAEVGFGPNAANSSMFSRARIKDGGGSPTTISVLSDEYLDVSYELRLYPDHVTDLGAADAGTGSIDIGGTTYNYSILPDFSTPAKWGSNASAIRATGDDSGIVYEDATSIGTISQAIQGATDSEGWETGLSVSDSTYSAGTYSRTITWSFGLGDGNFTNGINAYRLQTNMGLYKVLLDASIPKTSSKTMTLALTLAWTRKTIT